MTPEKVRSTILIAIASDDALSEALTLKGGNALELIYRIGGRASLDMDFSVEDDLSDAEAFGERLGRALFDRFDAEGYRVFDWKFVSKPAKQVEGGLWGGYSGTFKLISREKALVLNNDLANMRRQAEEVNGPALGREFQIQISKFEFCDGRRRVKVDEDYTCYVYTPQMIAAEKLRAICQQMPEYSKRGYPTPRARDFYDIHAIEQHERCDFTGRDFCELVRAMFNAKQVPLEFLRQIPKQKGFHEIDWDSVRSAVRGVPEPFDHYFDFVCNVALEISEALGIE